MPNFTKFNQAFNPADVQEFFHYDEAEDKSIIYKTQDVEPILNRNKIEMNHIDQSGDIMKHVACIPRIVIDQWRNQQRYVIAELLIHVLHNHCRRVQ